MQAGCPLERARLVEPLDEVQPARIGPTVCELEGPMPTEKRSKTLTVIATLLSLWPAAAGHGRGGKT